MPFETSNITHHGRVYDIDGGFVVENNPQTYVNNTPVYATDYFTFNLSDTVIGPGTGSNPIVPGDRFGFYFKSDDETEKDSFYDWIVTAKSGSQYSFSKSYEGIAGFQASNGFVPPGYLPNPDTNRTSISMGGYRNFAQRYFAEEKPEDFPFGDWELKLYYASLPTELPADGSSDVILKEFEMRGIAITNLKSTPERIEVDGVVQKVTITGDITVYPNMDTNGAAGWTPTEPIDWKVVIKHEAVDPAKWVVADTTAPGSTYLPITPTAPNSAGVVGQFSMEWNGTFDSLDTPPYDTDNVAFLPMTIEARAMVQTSTSPLRNTISPLATSSVHCKKCENSMIEFNATMMFLIALFGESGPMVPLGHNSNENQNTASSMGYGWFSTENIKVVDISTALDKSDLAYVDETGMTRRWVKVAGNYVPVLPDNRITIAYNAGGGDATFIVRWRDQYRREFNAAGQLRKEVDRNGRTTTYTKTANYLKMADDKGRDVYMHFNAGEAQPRVINDNANSALGRRQVLDYYMDGSTQKQLKSIQDPVGDKTVFVYDSKGRISEQREELANHHRAVQFTYDPAGAGRLASKKVLSTLKHPSNPLLDEVTEHYEERYKYQVPFSYGGMNYVTTKTVTEDLQPGNVDQPEALIRTFYRAYDALSRVLGEFEYVKGNEALDSSYIATLHEYNDPSVSGNPPDPWLRTRTFQVNKGAETLFFYTLRGNLKRTVDNEGNETLLTYVEENPSHPAYANFKDLVTSVRRPAPDQDNAPSTFYPTTKFTYYATTGNLESVEDAAGKVAFFRYNSYGQVDRIINRRGFKTYMEYNSRALVTKIHTQKSLAPSPSVTEFVNETATDFRTVEMTYNGYDNLTLTEDANNVTVGMSYDGVNRPTTVTDGIGVSRTFTYLNRMLDSVTLPNSSAGVDGSGNPLSHTGRLAKTSYDSSGRSLAVLRQDSAHTTPEKRVGFAYDGFSQLRALLRTKNGTEKAHRTEYDRQGRTLESIDANGKTSTAEYEPFCVGYATTSARGVRSKSSFDTLCRLTQVEVGTPDLSDPLEVLSASETRSFLYDDLGRLIKTTQNANTSSIYGQAVYGQNTYGGVLGAAEEREMEYDSLDRVTKIIFEDDKEMSYLYDDEGNVTQVTENASSATPKVTQFSYLGDNRLHTVTYVRGPGGVDSQTFEYAYDPGGRPETLTYPTSTGIVTEFKGPNNEVGWDGNGQLKFLQYRKGTDIIRRFEYGYDPAGNRISQLDVKGVGTTKATSWAYSYDWLDRLETVKKAEASTVGALGALQLVSVYSYDAADNRTRFEVPQLSEVYESFYDDADNITRIDKTVGAGSPVTIESFTSDPDGNLLTRTDPATSVVTTYQWDDFDRLKRVESTENAETTRLQDNRYGVDGIRKRKLDKNGNSSTEYTAGITTSVSKGGSGSSAAPTISYVMGHMLLGAEIDGVFRFHLMDAQGSVRDVVDDSGAVVKSFEFQEHGLPISSSGSGSFSPKTYQGGLSVNDDTNDSGLYLMGHRHFASDLGRFISRDPIGFSGGLNLYNGAGTNPVSRVDPTGLEPWWGVPDPHEIELRAHFPLMDDRDNSYVKGALGKIGEHSQYKSLRDSMLATGLRIRFGDTGGADIPAHFDPSSNSIVLNKGFWNSSRSACSPEVNDGIEELLAGTLVHELTHAQWYQAGKYSGAGQWAPELAAYKAQANFASISWAGSGIGNLALSNSPALKALSEYADENQMLQVMTDAEIRQHYAGHYMRKL